MAKSRKYLVYAIIEVPERDNPNCWDWEERMSPGTVLDPGVISLPDHLTGETRDDIMLDIEDVVRILTQ